MELAKRRSIYFFQEDEDDYMKVTMQFPGDVPTCRALLSVQL